MKQFKKQQGISLIEMMVSMSIGLLLLLGLGSIYVVANKANKDNEILSANGETARQIFDRLNYDFKRAGFVDLYDSPTESFKQQSLGLPAGVPNCPEGSPVLANTMYGKITGNKTNKDMVKVYKRLIDADPAVEAKDKLSKAFLAPISMISCGSMRPVFGCDGNITRPDGISYPDVFKRATCTVQENENAIEIAYQAVAKQASGLSVLPEIAENCSYDKVNEGNAADNNGFIINRYFVEDNTFKCQGNIKRGGNAPPSVDLVNGVVEIGFRYVTTVPEENDEVELVNSDSGRVVTTYKKASDVSSTKLGWPGVVAVEVCLVISTPTLSDSGSSNLAESQGNQRPACRNADDNFINKDKEDKKLYYQRYVRTFSLPNSLYAPIKK